MCVFLLVSHVSTSFSLWLAAAKDIEFNRIGAHNAPAIFGVKDYLQS